MTRTPDTNPGYYELGAEKVHKTAKVPTELRIETSIIKRPNPKQLPEGFEDIDCASVHILE